MAKYNFYIEDVSVEAVFNKLGGVEGARRLLRNELIISEPMRSWSEEDGIIRFSVISDGTTGQDWIKRLESRGFSIGDGAKQILSSPYFKPTCGVTNEIAILKGVSFGEKDRISKVVRANADRRKFSKPNVELACLIREKFTDKEIIAMGLWYIVVMHEPINGPNGNSSLLYIDTDQRGRRLNVYNESSGGRWCRDDGFAFVVSTS